MADCGLTSDEVAYIGDDLTDAVVMRRVGLAVATANARAEVKRIATTRPSIRAARAPCGTCANCCSRPRGLLPLQVLRGRKNPDTDDCPAEVLAEMLLVACDQV
jgi:hypothetical protein